jgi:hypothetical protein
MGARRLVARFDVYRFQSRAAPLVVDVQTDILSDLASRGVVPPAPADRAAAVGVSNRETTSYPQLLADHLFRLLQHGQRAV